MNDVVGAAIQEAFQLIHVIREDRKESTGGTILEPSHLQSLHVSVDIHPGLMLNRLRNVAPRDPEKPLEDRLERPDHHGGEPEDQELMERIGETHLRDEGILPLHHHIKTGPDDEGRCQIEDLVENRAERRPRDAPAERPGVSEQTTQRKSGRPVLGWGLDLEISTHAVEF